MFHFVTLEKVYLTSLVNHSRYLDSRKVTEGDAKHTAYEWGARAKEELDPEIILNFVADVCLTFCLFLQQCLHIGLWQMQGVDPIVWRNQYEQQLSRA